MSIIKNGADNTEKGYITKMIRLDSISDVKKFVNAACVASFDIDLVSGRYTIDAKSIMGIFSLDLTRPVEMKLFVASEDKAEGFLASIKELLA